MARYGITQYGADTYGDVGVNAAVFAVPMQAQSGTSRRGAQAQEQHNRIYISWAIPGGKWDRLRLVRSAAGYAAHSEDGAIIHTSTFASPSSAFQDDNLTAGRFYYYSLFVRTVDPSGRSLWVRSADAQGLSVANHNYGRTLLNRLPRVYTAGSSLGEPDESSALGRFCQLLGFKLDEYASLLESLRLVNDADRVPGNLLPSLAAQVGVRYEPEIGMYRNRVLTRNAARLSKFRCTERGITGLASSVTGYGATMQPFYNLVANRDDSSARLSTGAWKITPGATLTRSISVEPHPGADDRAVFVLTNNATARDIDLTDSSFVHVQPQIQYALTAFFKSPGGGVQTQLTVQFFDQEQVLLSESAPVSNPASTTAWGRISGTATAPAKAVYAKFRIRLLAVGANQVHHLDAIQFEKFNGSNPRDFQSARLLTVRLIAPRVNELGNSGFDSSVNNWTSSGTLTWDGTVAAESPGGSAKITVAANAGADLHQRVVVDHSQAFVAAAQVRSNGTGTARLEITYLTTAGNFISVETGAPFTIGKTFTRVTFNDITPGNATQAVFRLVLSGAPTTWHVDDCQFEHGNGLGDYFGLRTNPGEVLFEGPFETSRSHLYPVFLARRARLQALLDEQIPQGAVVALRLAVPRGDSTLYPSTALYPSVDLFPQA